MSVDSIAVVQQRIAELERALAVSERGLISGKSAGLAPCYSGSRRIGTGLI
jgi:hypothetical protein